MDPYREFILDHWKNPRNYGRLDKPDVIVDETNPLCGDILHIEAKISGNKVTELVFEGQGCAISLAAASVLTEKAKGQSFKHVKEISDQELLDDLGVTLSPVRLKCALLAVSGLRRGLKTV